VSANYKCVSSEGPVVTKRWRLAGASDIWAEHLKGIEAAEAAGTRVDRRSDFQAFADMLRREFGSV